MVFTSLQAQRLHELAQAPLVDGTAVERHGQRHVLKHRKGGNEVEELIDDAHLAATQHRKLLVVARVHVVAGQVDAARGGTVHAAHEVQQSRLARARRTHDGEELTLGHRKRHVVESAGSAVSLAVHLGEVLDIEYVHGLPFILRRKYLTTTTMTGRTFTQVTRT